MEEGKNGKLMQKKSLRRLKETRKKEEKRRWGKR